LLNLPATAISTALSISASSRLLKASLPPNSSTDFLNIYLQLRPYWNLQLLPVNETPLILSSLTKAVLLLPEINRGV
jgi:hypothetical protein